MAHLPIKRNKRVSERKRKFMHEIVIPNHDFCCICTAKKLNFKQCSRQKVNCLYYIVHLYCQPTRHTFVEKQYSRQKESLYSHITCPFVQNRSLATLLKQSYQYLYNWKKSHFNRSISEFSYVISWIIV